MRKAAALSVSGVPSLGFASSWEARQCVFVRTLSTRPMLSSSVKYDRLSHF